MTETIGDIRSRLRVGVRQAMKARQRDVVAAYRCALAAIDNAEAVRDEHVPRAGAIEDALIGVGAAEVERRTLTAEEIREIVIGEAAEREEAAQQTTNSATADGLRSGAAALRRMCEC